jgi:ParB family chromosome partitioning protein
MTAPVAQIQKIPLNQLAPSPYNARRIRIEARVEEIARSLETEGQREPITVYPGTGKDSGSYLIVSGITRCLAAQLLGWKTLDARIDTTLDPANDLSLVKTSRLHNDTCRETELDHAILARELLEAGHTADAIAKALGYGTQRDVTRLKAYFDLPEPILEVFKTKPEKFSPSFAELFQQFVTLLGEGKTLPLAQCVLEEDLSFRETKRRLEQMRERRVKRRARGMRSLELLENGQSAGRFRVLITPDRKRDIQLHATFDKGQGEALSGQLEALLKRFIEEGESHDAQNLP